MTESLIGRDLEGYIVEEQLGTGGMAHVYRALDKRLGRYVAIKIIQPEAQLDDNHRFRFEREARAVAQLEHPNIVSIYRFGEVDNLYYMAMQYIEGADLKWILDDYADDNELIPPDDALQIMKQVAAALDYAHSKGVIHRDIKPSNIMLDGTARAILADFGLVLLASEGTRGEIFGTPKYIAPEQAINSAGAVPQSDQYALGVILYQMFTGQVPFDGDTHMEVAMKHISDPLPPMLELNPDLSPAIVRVIEKALEKEPGNRYGTCTELMEALERAVSSPQGGVSTTRVSLMGIDDQIKEFRASNPLPPLPAAVAGGSSPPPAQKPVGESQGSPLPKQRTPAPKADASPAAKPAPKPAPKPAQKPEPESAQPAQKATVGAAGSKKRGSSPSRSKSSTLTVKSAKQRNMWLWVGIASVVIIIVGIIAIIILLGSNSDSGDNSEGRNDNPAIVVQDTDQPTDVPEQPTNTSAPPSNTPEQPTNTPQQPSSTPEQVAAVSTVTRWDLRLLAKGDDSLLVINETASEGEAFPLTLLHFSRDGEVVLRGNAWGIAELGGGRCVLVAKKEDAKTPDSDCDPTGDVIVMEGEDRFWKKSFGGFTVVFNNGSLRTECDIEYARKDGCTMVIPMSIVSS